MMWEPLVFLLVIGTVVPAVMYLVGGAWIDMLDRPSPKRRRA